MSHPNSQAAARRRLLGTLAALPAFAAWGAIGTLAPLNRANAQGVQAMPHAGSHGAGSFVLSSAKRAAQIRERVSPELAATLVSKEQANLTRTPHPRAVVHGEDWYGAPQVQGWLAAALHWLGPYAAGKLPHEEFVHSTVRFDARRAAAHVEGYAGPWRRDEASNLYWMAARLDPRFTALAAALEPQPTNRALFA